MPISDQPAEHVTLTERLSCICGGLLSVSDHSNGLYTLKCQTQGCMSYGIADSSPMFKKEARNTVLFSGFSPASEPLKPAPVEIMSSEEPIQLFNCKLCGVDITRGQAMRTYNEQGKAMCGACEGEE